MISKLNYWQYTSPAVTDDLLWQISVCVQQHGETVAQFADRLDATSAKAYPKVGKSERQ